MMEWYRSGGVFMWPILVAAVLVVVLSARTAFSRRDVVAPESRRGRADAVLFWGAFAAAVGLFGTLGGLAQLARVVEHTATVPSSLIWGGVGVTLVTTIFGLAVLLVALILWYVLRSRGDTAA